MKRSVLTPLLMTILTGVSAQQSDSIRISYYYNLIHDAPQTTWIDHGQSLTFHDVEGCEVARCEASRDGQLRAFNLSCSGPPEGTFGPWVDRQCSQAYELPYKVECCMAPLRLSKTGSHHVADTPGTELTYTYVVTNESSTTVTNVAVGDDSLGTVSLSDDAGDGPDVIAPGDSETGTLRYTVTLADLQANTPIHNTATVTSDQGGPETAEWTVSVVPMAQLELSKTGSTHAAGVLGAEIVYTYTVTNTGRVDLTNLAVEDDVLGPVTLSDLAGDGVDVLAPDGTETGTLSYTITQSDLDDGSPIQNKATATSDQANPVSAEWVVLPTEIGEWAWLGKYECEACNERVDMALISTDGEKTHSLLERTSLRYLRYSPGGSVIAGQHHSLSVLYVMDVAGGLLFSIEVDHGPTQDYFHDTWWFPDSSAIMVGWRTLDLSTGGTHLIELPPGYWNSHGNPPQGPFFPAFDPALGPDLDPAPGFQGPIAFTRLCDPSQCPTGDDVVLMTAEQQGPKLVVTGEPAVVTGLHEGTADAAYSNQSWPTFSPDGTKLAFFRGDHHAEGGDSLAVVDVDALTLTVDPSSERVIVPREVGAPYSWSPDGQWIAFHANWTDPWDFDGWGIYRVKVDGSCTVDVSGSFADERYVFFLYDWNPQWSGDSVNPTCISGVGVEDPVSAVPDTYRLSQNYPNPFNPASTISYDLPLLSEIKLAVYDVLGRQVRVLASGRKPPGTYEVAFDATTLPSGVYFYRLKAGDHVETKRMVVVK